MKSLSSCRVSGENINKLIQLNISTMNGPVIIRREVRLKIAQGLHIRACSNVTALVIPYDGYVKIHFGNKSADASSMFDLIQLAAPPDSLLILEAAGENAEEILNQLEQLLSTNEDSPNE